MSDFKVSKLSNSVLMLCFVVFCCVCVFVCVCFGVCVCVFVYLNDFNRNGIFMNSVDVGWVSSAVDTFVEPPLTCQDAADR